MSNVVSKSDPLTSLEVTMIANLLALATSPNGQAISKTGETTFTNVSAGGGAGYQVPTGIVDGANQTFVYPIAPNVISSDGLIIRKVANDGTVNWTGNTTIVMTIAPNSETYGIA